MHEMKKESSPSNQKEQSVKSKASYKVKPEWKDSQASPSVSPKKTKSIRSNLDMTQVESGKVSMPTESQDDAEPELHE